MYKLNFDDVPKCWHDSLPKGDFAHNYQSSANPQSRCFLHFAVAEVQNHISAFCESLMLKGRLKGVQFDILYM